jgi:hypothetical protein
MHIWQITAESKVADHQRQAYFRVVEDFNNMGALWRPSISAYPMKPRWNSTKHSVIRTEFHHRGFDAAGCA